MSVEALQVLRAVVRGVGPSPPEWDRPAGDNAEYAAWRFVQACRDASSWTADHAVLLRQVLRWYEKDLYLGVVPERLVELCIRAGVEVFPSGKARATAFAPEWLKGDRIDASRGVDARPDLCRPDESVPGEPYLRSIGYEDWQSQAQKEAVWTALTAPPGSTTLIALPTGSGKSLCFQVLSRFGTGLTVVVVPTVALAIDQYRSAMTQFRDIPDLNPRYFAAGDANIDPDTVVREIREARTRLIFTSPEACVSGRLRGALIEAAQSGRLENLVVDEAHIIESWGVFFRVDFQMLSSVRKQWLEDTQHSLRTYLLSATFTPNSTEVLRGLFGQGGEWREFVSQRLRPELKYFVRRFNSDDERDRAVLECAWRLPRPAIFFTTEVDEAKRLAATLRQQEGFVRVGCFHGETSSAERRELLAKWRDDEIDVMVATSAFGLGVDKSDVRAVVHACYPETLHRYYQEAGRAGRDGASAVCILLPTVRDKKVAEGLLPNLLSDEIAASRWTALWQSAKSVGDDEHSWVLETDAKRTDLLGTRVWRQNVLWNKRLILQLARAGAIDLQRVEYHAEEGTEQPVERVTVRLRFTPTAPRVLEIIGPHREREHSVWNDGLRQIEEYVTGNKPLCRILKQVYGPTTQVVCGGCPGCRAQGRPKADCPSLEFETVLDGIPSLEVIGGGPDLRDVRGAAKFKTLAANIIDRKRIRRLICTRRDSERIREAFLGALGIHSQAMYRLDSFAPDTVRRVVAEDQFVVFHIGTIDLETLSFRYGKRVTHILCGADGMDSNGRYPLEAEGASLYATPEYWLTLA